MTKILFGFIVAIQFEVSYPDYVINYPGTAHAVRLYRQQPMTWETLEARANGTKTKSSEGGSGQKVTKPAGRITEAPVTPAKEGLKR